MKKMLTAAIALLTSATAFTQIPIAYYDFESNTTRTTFENAVEQQINSGSTAISNNNLSTPAGSAGAGGYNGNIFASGTALLEYQFSTGTTDPGLTTTKYIQFTTNVSGFTGISISMNTFTPSFLLGVTQGPTNLGINFSTDGTTFTNIAPVALTRGITWETKTLNFPASANNASSLIVRIYAYGADGSDGGLLIDNLNVLATGTVAGKVFTSLNEDNLYTSTTSGATGGYLNRGNFAADGAGTVMTLGSTIQIGSGSALTVSNSAVLSTGSGSSYYVQGAGGFTLNSGTGLIIRDVSGISNNLLTGNIRVLGTRSISGGAFFTYTQATGLAMATGNALPTPITGSVTINNSNPVTLTQATAFSSTGVLFLTTGTFTNGALLTMNNGSTINRDAGILSAAPTFNAFINLIYSGSTGVTTALEVPSAAGALGNFTLAKNAAGNTITLGSAVQLNGTFTPTTGALSLANFDFSIRSTSTYTARVAAVGSVTFTYGGTGRFIVERYISSGRKWRFLSVPTDDATYTFRQGWQEGATSQASNPVAGFGTQITDNKITWSANGFDAQSASGPSVKQWNGTAYTGITSTSSPMKTTRGYMTFVRGDRTATAANSTVAATVLRTKGALYTGTQTAITIPSGGTIVSVNNPYASSIDLRTLTFSGIAGNAFYVWDPKLTGTYSLGAYQTISKVGSNFVIVPGGGSYGANGSTQNFIQSGQAFFVIGGAGGSLTFTEAAKGTADQQVFRINDAAQQLSADLLIRSGINTELVDGTAAFADPGFSNEANDGDAPKIANTTESVSLLRDGKDLAVETRSSLNPSDTFFLRVKNFQQRDYQWRITLTDAVQENGSAVLFDKFLNTYSDLSPADSTLVNFSITADPASSAADRFTIMLRPANITAVDPAPLNTTPSFGVYPNPVTDGNINLKLTNKPAGKYHIIITDKAGRILYSADMYFSTGNEIKTIHLNAAAGIYSLALISNTGERENLNISVR